MQPKHTHKCRHTSPPHPHPPSTCMAIPNWLLSKLVMQRATVRRKRRNVFIDESDELINRYPLHCREMDRRLACPCRRTHTHTHLDEKLCNWFYLSLFLSLTVPHHLPEAHTRKNLSLRMSTNLFYDYYNYKSPFIHFIWKKVEFSTNRITAWLVAESHKYSADSH